jgi:hypothetical protein
MNNLPDLKKFVNLIAHETDELKRLEKRVNEIMIDEMIKDCILHNATKEIKESTFVYNVKRDDFNHIVANINLIQTSLLPDITVLAWETKDDHRVLFSVYERD